MSTFWLIAMVVFGILEAATTALVSIWFVPGSAAALIAASLQAPLWLQLLLFALVSAAALLLTRPLARRFLQKDKVPTNADRVLGKTVKVTEDIDNESAKGAVYADGKTWSARSEDGPAIPAGAMVEVLRMEGVKLFVREIERDGKTQGGESV